MFVDAIKNFVTSRTERFRALYKNPSRFLLATSDFRLYELLKNDSRFLRITDANAPASCRDSLASAIKVDHGSTQRALCSQLPLSQNFARLLRDWMVEDDGIEPTTPCLQSRCSPS